MEKLYDYQKSHVKRMVKILNTSGRVLDASRTGLGKTYCSIVSCLMAGLMPFIICPNMMIKTWIDVCEELECPYYGITSYELIQNCKMYNKKGKKVKCDLINYKDSMIKSGENVDYVISDNLPENVIPLYDEVHKCKNIETNNAKILKAFGKTNIKLLLLSATVADKPMYFILVGWLLRLYQRIEDGHSWLLEKVRTSNTQNFMLVFHNQIFPNHASKMNDDILTNNFPNCKINAMCYDMADSDEIEQLYKNINDKSYLKNRHNLKIQIELLKVNKICHEIKKDVKNGNSVIIFVNYKETVHAFMRMLETNCAIFGDFDMETCLTNKNNFVNDNERIIICTIKKGSGSISLHDVNGNHPRITYIFPPDSVSDLIQSIGRAWRSGVKTKTIQNIVFSNCPEEQKLQFNMIGKINNVSLLNNGEDTNVPLLKIDNMIEETKDIVTEFGKKIKISKADKEKLKREIAEKAQKEQERIRYLENLCNCNNYKGLLSELKKAKYNKTINTDKDVLSQINGEISFIESLIDRITMY